MRIFLTQARRALFLQTLTFSQGECGVADDFQSGLSVESLMNSVRVNVESLMTFSQGECGVADDVSQGELYGYKRLINLIWNEKIVGSNFSASNLSM